MGLTNINWDYLTGLLYNDSHEIAQTWPKCWQSRAIFWGDPDSTPNRPKGIKCLLAAHLTIEQANDVMEMERASGVSGPLAAAVMDNKVMVVLIYRQDTPTEELQSRLDVTMTDKIKMTYLN